MWRILDSECLSIVAHVTFTHIPLAKAKQMTTTIFTRVRVHSPTTCPRGELAEWVDGIKELGGEQGTRITECLLGTTSTSSNPQA